MLINQWSIALNLLSLALIFTLTIAATTAIRVVSSWQPAADHNRQIRLENEIWLTSTLIKYALAFLILNLFLFVMAADNFSQIIAGAMCATGALLANSYGMPALYTKIIGIFFYGFWIIIHQLDISSERYPLVKFKYGYLLLLYPLIIVDLSLQTLYLVNLDPDIITSCCAVVFQSPAANDGNLIANLPAHILPMFYGAITLVGIINLSKIPKMGWSGPSSTALFWILLLPLALIAITTVFSSYIYAMPFHHCPFCILKPEYNYIGFAIYSSLFTAVFFGLADSLAACWQTNQDLEKQVHKFRRFSRRLALIMLSIFTVLSSWHYLLYSLLGGES